MQKARAVLLLLLLLVRPAQEGWRQGVAGTRVNAGQVGRVAGRRGKSRFSCRRPDMLQARPG